MKKKKIVIMGGGTGLSTLLKGLKNFPVDITAVVSVCDDGKSTGRLREEFNTPAVGDIRRVIISLAEVEPLVEKLINYRFNTYSDLNGHTVGNLLLTALCNINGNMSDGIEALSKVFNLSGRVLPLTEDNVKLVAKMKDGKVVHGEHNITNAFSVIDKIYYKDKPKVNEHVIEKIKEADLVILSMGSLYTSTLPNLLPKEIKTAIDNSNGKIMYVANIMTQRGETDDYAVSDHVIAINKYLGKRKLDLVIANNGKISNELVDKYAQLEQKDPVYFDYQKTKKQGVKIISDDYVIVEDESNYLRHNVNKVALHIYGLLI